MRAVLCLLAAAAVFVLTFAGGASPEPPPRAAARFGVAIHSEPSPALVFIDGRFAGQTHPDAPLTVVLSSDRCQLRLSEAGRLDAVRELKLEADRMTSVRAMLPARNEPWSAPAFPVRIRVGQPLRGIIDRSGQGPRYIVTEDAPPHRMLVGLANRLSFKVTAPDGGAVKIAPLDATPAGTPGNGFQEYRGAAAGDYLIAVSGAPGPFSFRFVNGLPPLADTDDSRLKGRRLAPMR